MEMLPVNAEAPVPAPGDIATAFRGAMRRLASTVSVVTALADGRPLGMTMTAVTSLAMDPPSLLICVNSQTRLHAALSREGEHFCVNLLRHGQEEMASAFGGGLPPEHRFGIGDWAHDENGVPYLRDAQSNLFCTMSKAISHGSHTVFIGTVRQVRLEGEVGPLLYGDGRYLPFASGAKSPN